MPSHRRFVHIAFALTVVAAFLLPVTSAGAATTYEIAVGVFLEGAPAESMRFLPGTIDVHQGDTLHFTLSGGFHTTTFLPVGEGVVEWFDANATYGSSQPFAPVAANPDSESHSVKFGNSVLFPTSDTCGAPGQPACSFDGTTVLNSGTPVFFGADLEFSATVDVGAGSSFWVVCIWHGSPMRMRVDVVAGSEPASDQAEIDAATAATIRQDTDTAAALHAKFSAKRTFHTRPNGTRVWDAWAGVGNRHLELFAFYPQTLRIDRGDVVQWHFDSLVTEDHTVTLPLDKGLEIVDSSLLVCDPDGDTGPGPDNPPDLEGPPFCSDPAQLEIQIPSRFVFPRGDGRFRGRDLENSGGRGANSQLFGGDGNYNVRFVARSSAGGFEYVCLIHPFMQASVVVG